VEFLSYQIVSNDFNRAGDASRALKEQLKRIGVDAEAIRRTMIATYEGEMNVVIHAQGGRLEAHLAEEAVHVDVIDYGPGIPNVELAMKEGFSTANAEARALGFGAGMGLPNIKRSSDRLRVTSRVGEGTRISFTVYFKRDNTRPPHFVSLQASPERCQECGRCLAICPTQAIRIRDHLPIVLESLCIDCGACIAACKAEALIIRNDISTVEDLGDISQTVLAIPPAFLADCGAKYPPDRVLAALKSLGFAKVISLRPYEKALREETIKIAEAEGSSRPLITPVCPAIVNLIELRFPSLIPHLAPFDSPIEAVQAGHADRPIVYVVSCPSQRSALVSHEVAAGLLPGRETITEYVTPALLRQAAMERLVAKTGAGNQDIQKSAVETYREGQSPCAESGSAALVVTGVDHVMAVLEELENGLLTDIAVVEPYACQGGCFGSPFFHEDFHVSTRRWEETCGPADPPDNPPTAVARRLAYTARLGIRLDADMALAIEKLGRLQTILQTLPGKDCGACGAPSCTALAEDVVLERAVVEDCPYLNVTKGRSNT
jgi:anti-sigma regulatory factor (Ser/Thr protein kinase)/Na+-translocating ferredoxin:NAD+ oxidoreductase RNF subunit RnfB